MSRGYGDETVQVSTKLDQRFPGCALKPCYEASYIGFTLQRDLTEKGYAYLRWCPTSIPSPCGKSIKTGMVGTKSTKQG